MSFPRRHVQRCPSTVILRIDVSPVLKEKPRHRLVPFAGRLEQRRRAILVSFIYIERVIQYSDTKEPFQKWRDAKVAGHMDRKKPWRVLVRVLESPINLHPRFAKSFSFAEKVISPLILFDQVQ